MSAATDPQSQMSQLLGGYRVTQMLYVATVLGLADHLSGGPVALEQLAVATNTHAPSLYRLLRSLASLGVFIELEGRQFASTPLAATLREGSPGSLWALALSYGEPWWWDSFGEMLYCVRTGETGFSKANGTTLFSFLEQHPDAARVFNANMSAMTRVEAEAVANAYEFDATSVLVDVGGGHGVLANAILCRWPNTSAVVFDQPSVVAGAGAVASQLVTVSRCTFAGGDFFASVPSGGDVYILKDILHDWDDEKAQVILCNCHAAMRTDARLLIIERVVPQGNGPSVAKQIDITMLVLTGGQERTRDEYDRLLNTSGFSIKRTIEMPTAGSIIEAFRT